MHSQRKHSIFYPTFGDYYGMTTDIAHNLHIVQQRIADAAERAGREVDEITLVAVSKTFPVTMIAAAYDIGIRHFGENRVEEAAQKIPRVNSESNSTKPIIWHLVGHLQSRKVKDAGLLFDFIHSIDSVAVAERIDKQAAVHGKKIAVLLEVNTSGEATKFGFPIQSRGEFFAAADQILALPHLDVVGLMTIAPIVQQSNDARPGFSALRVLRDELRARRPSYALPHLSMGMTDDFEAAILEGATLLRIGRAIFGERP